MTKRSYLILAAAVAIGVLAVISRDRLPTFDDLKTHLDTLLAQVEMHPVGFRLAFFVAYIFACACLITTLTRLRQGWVAFGGLSAESASRAHSGETTL